MEKMQQLMAKQLIAKVAEAYSSKPLELSLSNNSPILTLTCQECGLVKKSTEEMEIHIKVEHINWLPFKCPHCKTHRASDAQMREHIHASHKQNAKEFIYVDNLDAKRKLQILLDQALYATVSKKLGLDEHYESAMSPEASTAAHSTTSSDSPPGEPSSPTVLTMEQDGPATAKVEIRTGGDSNTDALLASITQAAKTSSGSSGLREEEEETETDPLILLLKSYKTEGGEVEGEVKDESNVDLSIFDSLFAKGVLGTDSSFNDTPNKKNSTQQSKKKVVGMCKACKKPVTAGARQMHLFFHLAKDYQVFRFYCKFEGCEVEHYRKDQMEHHMTKTHGQIQPELIGDRTDELYHKSKELQQELLGEMTVTVGEQPTTTTTTPLLKRPAPTTPSHPPDDKQTLQCNICHKFMENRVKGFHILHHLARDKGIMRYTCMMCDFAHDRSQSVLGHGKKEHGREDVVLDRIADYEEEVQEMSQKCFGIDTNFETSKKKAKGSVYISKMPKLDLTESLTDLDETADGAGSPNEDEDDAME